MPVHILEYLIQFFRGQKFDPNGEYVKKYIPELKNVSNKFIHNPWEMSEENQIKF